MSGDVPWFAVVEPTLPAGLAVPESEVGKPGPWHGWRLPGAPDYGWALVPGMIDEQEAIEFWTERGHLKSTKEN